MPFQVLIYLCNAADIIYRSNGKPHDSAEPKSASVWELHPAICLSGRRTWHKHFCALRYQPLQFPPAPLFTLMSHWLGVCHPVHAASRACVPFQVVVLTSSAVSRMQKLGTRSHSLTNERAQTVHVLVHWWFPVESVDNNMFLIWNDYIIYFEVINCSPSLTVSFVVSNPPIWWQWRRVNHVILLILIKLYYIWDKS